ncbi:M10 family metallopeptidase C-terminal domain-containing protein [Salipiger sp.]|uniref:M10 family metallopeptidase C-terminal domain-containing protein n=1 Tax=Salipiger sp. TaxID=2078585 RepID=UPI003A976050
MSALQPGVARISGPSVNPQFNYDITAPVALRGDGAIIAFLDPDSLDAQVGDYANLAVIRTWRFSESGRPLGQSVRADDNRFVDFREGVISPLADGGAIIMLVVTERAEFTDELDAYMGVHLLRIDSSGNRVGAPVRLEYDGYLYTALHVTELSDGNIVASWSELDGISGNFLIRYQVLSENGERIGDVVTAAVNDGAEFGSEMVALNGGGFAMVWRGAMVDGSLHGAEITLFDANGVKQGESIAVELPQAPNDPNALSFSDLQLTALPDGGFAVAGRYFADFDFVEGLFIQSYTASGMPTSAPDAVTYREMWLWDLQRLDLVAGVDGLPVLAAEFADQSPDYAAAIYSDPYTRIEFLMADGDGTLGYSEALDTEIAGLERYQMVALHRLPDGEVRLSFQGDDLDNGRGVDGYYHVTLNLDRQAFDDGPGGGAGPGGTEGRDLYYDAPGAQAYDGLGGDDTVDYRFADGRVLADLRSDISDQPFARFFDRGAAEGDTYASIESLVGGGFADNLRGDAGANVLEGGGRSDRLYGRGGDDLLIGGAGADALYGNLGADTMIGGEDAGRRDRFIYFQAEESGVGAGNRDIITDFVAGEDRIEISRIDADTTQGFKQAFDFIGDAAFSGTAGELRFGQGGGVTLVQADRDGDGVADFEIELTGLVDLTESDFLI